MAQVQTLGNVTSTVSTSNDVTVQYTDLQAQLASLQTEQLSLLRILNESSSVNNTLAIEQQLQQVDEQINITESQVLQTQRLVDYSTISVTVVKSTPSEPLTLKLTATPKSGTGPLSVTLNAEVSGGSGSYVVNYNFGDGTSQEGQAVIHQYYGSGDYNVTVTATDSKGNATVASTIIHVAAPPSTIGAAGFFTSVTNLFVNIIEGMVEVAVVVVPIGLVLIALALPLRRRLRIQKVKQA
jgi:PKD repeat protein